MSNSAPYLNYTLGSTTKDFSVDTSADLRAAIIHLASQTQHKVDIFSRNLDRKLLDDTDFIHGLSNMIRNNKNARVNILVHDSTPAVKDGHRLIYLYQKLSSYIEVRKVHNDYKNNNQAFIIFDNVATVYREFSDRYEASINYNAPLKAKELLGAFQEIWELSAVDSQLRRLHI